MTRQYLWDSPRLKTFDVVKLVDAHIKKGSTKSDACRFVAEEIFVRFNGPKLTPSQINNRYVYLKNKAKKLEKAVEVIANNPKVQEKLAEISEVPEPQEQCSWIVSTLIKNEHNREFNFNEWSYAIADGEKLARSIQKLYFMNNRYGRKITMNRLLEHLAGFFNVKPSTLYTRYHSNLKRIEKQKYVTKLEKDNVKALKAQLEIMTRSEKQERSFHLSLQSKVEQMELQLREQGQKIQQLRDQSLIDFIKMKIENAVLKCQFRKIWRR